MLAAGALWLISSSTALAVGGEFGTLMLGVSSNILVFYGFYQAWIHSEHDKDEEEQERRARHHSSEEEREQLQREAGK